MTTHQKPLIEVNQEAIRVLSEELGMADTVRFTSQFSEGHGNYTEERGAMFDHLGMNEIVARIRQSNLADHAARTK